MRRFRSKASFSLVELTVIVGILTVLLSFLFPGIQQITERSQRTKAARNLRAIALAHANYIQDFGHAISYTDACALKGSSAGNSDVNLFAAVLAKYGYLKDVSVWAWDFDYLIKNYQSSQSSFPSKIYNASNKRIAPEFSGKQSGGNFPLSVIFAVIQSPNLDYGQLLSPKIPFCASRGLKHNDSSGHWRPKSDKNYGGIWGANGGLVAFGDGHVEWCENIVNKFQKYNNPNVKTSIICEALPSYHAGAGNYVDSCFASWNGSGDYL